MFISYAQAADNSADMALVQRFWEFLRSCGVDARLDLAAAQERRDWALWMGDEIRAADFVVIIASRAYRERAEGRSGPDVGRGVQWEARLIRDAFYADQSRMGRFVPVVLPGETVDGVPDFLAPATSTVYFVSSFTVAGADELLRFLTGQPAVVEPELGPVPALKPRSGSSNRRTPRSRSDVPARPTMTVRNEISSPVSGVVIQAGSIDSVSTGGITVGATRSRSDGAAGVPGWRSTFQRVLSLLRARFEVGEPLTDMERYGPGLRWEFAGAGSAPGWVLCVLPDGRAAAVADTVWEGAHRADAGALQTESLKAVGFPVSPSADDPSPVIIDADAVRVDMDGGAWGPGLLVRSAGELDWEWQPKPVGSFGTEMTRAALTWTGESPAPELRIRVVATTDATRSTSWEITPEHRRHFETVLPDSDFAAFVATLAEHRGVVVPSGDWLRGPHLNRPGQASYSRTLVAPNGVPAAQIEVMAAASGNRATDLVTCAELRIHDAAAWTAVIAGIALPTPARLTVPDLRDLLVAAWRMATVDLLDLYGFPVTGRRWREVPRVEFRLTAESLDRFSLSDLIDFSAFGEGTPDHESQMAVTIPAAPHLTEQERRAVAPEALAYLGRNFGYLDATADRL